MIFITNSTAHFEKEIAAFFIAFFLLQVVGKGAGER